MVPILLTSIAEALVRMDTCKQNECHAPFLGNYSIMSKWTLVCGCDVALGLYRISFHLNYGYQIHKYHEKQQLLENRMIPNEARYTKNPIIISTIQKHNYLLCISYGTNSNKFIVMCLSYL